MALSKGLEQRGEAIDEPAREDARSTRILETRALSSRAGTGLRGLVSAGLEAGSTAARMAAAAAPARRMA